MTLRYCPQCAPAECSCSPTIQGGKLQNINSLPDEYCRQCNVWHPRDKHVSLDMKTFETPQNQVLCLTCDNYHAPGSCPGKLEDLSTMVLPEMTSTGGIETAILIAGVSDHLPSRLEQIQRNLGPFQDRLVEWAKELAARATRADMSNPFIVYAMAEVLNAKHALHEFPEHWERALPHVEKLTEMMDRITPEQIHENSSMFGWNELRSALLRSGLFVEDELPAAEKWMPLEE